MSEQDHKARLEEFEARKAHQLAMGGPDKLAKRREQNKLNARERIELMLDPGSFVEVGLFSTSARPEHRDETPQDGQITGYGKVHGRDVVIDAADMTVKGASSAKTNMYKKMKLMEEAERNGLPFVFFGGCAGARMPDSQGAIGMATYGMGGRHIHRTRKAPMIAGIADPSFGGSTWMTAVSDFVVMRKGEFLGVSSPKVTAVALSDDADWEHLGGWRVHMEHSGMVDAAVDTDEEMVEVMRRWLSYVPGHANEAPPRAAGPAGSGENQDRLFDLVPPSRTKVYDVNKVIDVIFDTGSFLPFKPRYAKSLSTGLARLDGHTVGICACNPIHKGGALDGPACDKYTSFIVFCDSFNIPIIMLVDTPGFLVGPEAERDKVAGRIMNNLQALEMTTVPKISVILRKSYGQAYLNFGGGVADEMAAWFTADVGFVDPAVGVSVVHNVRRDREPERFDELVKEMARDNTAYDLASIFAAQAVLDPRETRNWLIRMLEVHRRRLNGGVGEHRMCNWPTTF